MSQKYMIKHIPMAIQWININIMAHLKRKQIFGCGGHISSHAPIRTCSAEIVRILPIQGHIQLMCLPHNQASHKNMIYISKLGHDQQQNK